MDIYQISDRYTYLKASTNSFLAPDIIIEAVENKNRNLTNNLKKLQKKMSNLSYAMIGPQIWSAH